MDYLIKEDLINTYSEFVFVVPEKDRILIFGDTAEQPELDLGEQRLSLDEAYKSFNDRSETIMEYSNTIKINMENQKHVGLQPITSMNWRIQTDLSKLSTKILKSIQNAIENTIKRYLPEKPFRTDLQNVFLIIVFPETNLRNRK